MCARWHGGRGRRVDSVLTDAGRVSWDRLNAYVDGELGLEEAAEVAAALVHDGEAAAQVASLTRLRAAMRVGDAREDAPPFALPPAASAPRYPLPWAAALLVATLGLAWMAAGPRPTPGD